MSDASHILCPYCGEKQPKSGPSLVQCRTCGGRFDAWSLRATRNEMGPWFVRDSRRPHFVGFSLESLRQAIRSGEVSKDAVVRGPTTGQYWTLVRHVQGLAHIFGRCHACQAPVQPEDSACITCGASTDASPDRNALGLPPVEAVVVPEGARADLSAFVTDGTVAGGLALIALGSVSTNEHGATPQQTPAQIPAPAPSQTTFKSPVPVRPAPVAQAAVAQASAPIARADGMASSACTNIDRGLVTRVRKLESVNRLLFAATVLGLLTSLGIGIAYFALRERFDRDIKTAYTTGAESVRDEFKRREPVVVPKPAELPPMPKEPSRGAGAGAR
ncbi:MAG: hypothetical protein QM516_11460 [Limnohabitans sp.]|nr:hypothetical protein [Limnohabitans sp.]